MATSIISCTHLAAEALMTCLLNSTFLIFTRTIPLKSVDYKATG